MKTKSPARTTLRVVGAIVGAAVAVVVLYFSVVILIVLVTLWLAIRIAGVAARMIP